MKRVNADVVAFVVFFIVVGVLAWVYYPQREPTDPITNRSDSEMVPRSLSEPKYGVI